MGKRCTVDRDIDFIVPNQAQAIEVACSEFMRPIEQYVTMIQYYSQSVTESVVRSVKKLRTLL